MHIPSTKMHGMVSILLACVLILGRDAAMEGCKTGIQLCIQTVIPSLFPFCILSGYMVQILYAMPASAWKVPGRMVHMQPKELSVFIVGILGGYPLGAQCIRESWDDGYIDRPSANRMLTFCNNAGPAFVLGFGSRILSDIRICFLVWVIHVFSAYIVGQMSHPVSIQPAAHVQPQRIEPVKLIRKGTIIMALICAWIVLFGALLEVISRQFGLWEHRMLKVLFLGFMELSNGCSQLLSIDSFGLRIILFSVFLSFGGLCVLMQTRSVTDGLTMKGYLCGKIAQVCLSILFCIPVQFLLPSGARFFPHWGICASAGILLIWYFYNFHMNSAGNLQAAGV